MEQQQRTPRQFAKWAILIGSVALMLALSFAISSCNTPKATERRDIKRVAKAQGRNPHVIASACASYYPSIDSVATNIIYKAGEKVVVSDTVTITDTLTNVLTKYITRTEKTHDTSYITKYTQIVDRARETAQAKIIKDLQEQTSKQEQNTKWWRWLALIFGVYSILRWVLRIWKIKLP